MDFEMTHGWFDCLICEEGKFVLGCFLIVFTVKTLIHVDVVGGLVLALLTCFSFFVVAS